MSNKFQYLYFKKIIAVIKSCKDGTQLDNARKWFDRVTYINKLPVSLTNKIVRAYRAKKRQIQMDLPQNRSIIWKH